MPTLNDFLSWLLQVSIGAALLGAIILHTSEASGWNRLVRRFPAPFKPMGRISKGKSGRLNGTRYGKCLIIGIADDGLYLALLPLFRVGHAPLLIPWAALSEFKEEKVFFNAQYQTTISLSPDEHMILGIHNPEVATAIEEQRAKAVSPRAFSSI